MGCYEKAKEKGEPVFTLRAQDVSAPGPVIEWIKYNLANQEISEEKLRDAFEIALKMRRWPNRKKAD